MNKLDIGTVKSLKIDVLTETGWFDDARFKQNMADYGGAEQTQYRIAWDAENCGRLRSATDPHIARCVRVDVSQIRKCPLQNSAAKIEC